jgi:hypothetical protein
MMLLKMNAKLRIALILVAIFVIVAIGVSNCGGGGGAGVTPIIPNDPGGGNGPSGDDIVPSNDLKDVDNLPMTLTDINGNVYTYSYSGTPPDINPGDILASTREGGYLRGVISVVDTGSSLVITTDQATVDEAIVTGTLATSLDLTQRGGAAGASGLAITVPLTGEVIYSESGMTVEILDGNFVFAPLVNLSLNYNSGGLTHFLCSAEGVIETDIDMKAAGTGTFDLSSEKLVYTTAPSYFAMGPIGGTVYFDLYAGFELDGNVSGFLTSGIDSTVTASMGAEYINSAWGAIGDIQSAFDPGVIQGGAEGTNILKGYVRPVMRVEFAKLTCPQINIISGFEVDGTGTVSPPCLQYDLYGGFRADAMINTLILGNGTANFDGNLLNVREHVVNGSYGNCPDDPGGCNLLVGDITGPSQMTYNWFADPTDGYFANATSATATFHAVSVDSTKTFDVGVEVDSANCDKVTKHFSVTVTKFTCTYTVGMIEGPALMLGGQSRGYSVMMQNYSTQAVSFSWSVNPSSAGYFLRTDSKIVEFFANSVSGETPVTLEVDVESDACGTVTKSKEVTVSKQEGT